MGSIILGLLAESSLHPGGDVSSGVVDLPVARESTTSYPVLRGSGLKGALRDIFENRRNSGIVERIFGKPDGAGGVSVTDGRLLLLPVRSLTSNYYWVTCPYILERLQRDLQLVGFKKELPIPAIGVEEAILLAEDKNADRVYLEELSFTVSKNEEIIKGLAEVILPLILHDTTKARLVKQLAIINDDDFKYFASYGLPVNARNILEKETKISKNLWYEETIPADSLFYTLLFPRYGREEDIEEILKVFDEKPYMQIGGNETIGQGWCAVSYWKGGGSDV